MENLKQRNIIIHMEVFSTKTEAPKKFFELFFHLKSIWTFGKEPIVITLIGWVDGKHKKSFALPFKVTFLPYLPMHVLIDIIGAFVFVNQTIHFTLAESEFIFLIPFTLNSFSVELCSYHFIQFFIGLHQIKLSTE